MSADGRSSDRWSSKEGSKDIYGEGSFRKYTDEPASLAESGMGSRCETRS